MRTPGDVPTSALAEWRRLTKALEDFGPTRCETTCQPERWWEPKDEEGARELCRRCPVQPECLDYALAADERYGVWGATTPEERRRG